MLVVGTRWGRVASVLAASLAVVVLMVYLRRDPDFDFEDKLWTGLILFAGFWLSTLSLGMIVRRALAGHAMRFDAAGFHYPGWDLVPWSSIRGLSVETKEGKNKKQEYSVRIDVDPSCRAFKRGSYERWMFGPTEGLLGSGPSIKIKIVTMDIEPAALRAAFAGWQHRLAAQPRGNPER